MSSNLYFIHARLCDDRVQSGHQFFSVLRVWMTEHQQHKYILQLYSCFENQALWALLPYITGTESSKVLICTNNNI